MSLPLSVRYRYFKLVQIFRYQNLPPEVCWPEVKHVYTVSQPTSRGATCLYGLKAYLQGIVCQGCSMLLNLPKATPGDCRSQMQPAYTVSNPTYRGM